jgi:hypothetical protein
VQDRSRSGHRDDGSVSGIGLFSVYDPGTKRHPGTRTFRGHGNSLIRRRSVFVLTNGGVRSDSSKRDRMARQIWALPSMIRPIYRITVAAEFNEVALPIAPGTTVPSSCAERAQSWSMPIRARGALRNNVEDVR